MTRCWGLAVSTGTQAQVKALASALGVTAEIKAANTNALLGWLPNACFVPLQSLVIPYAMSPASEKLSPPWPELVISCGRRAAQVALGIEAKAGAATKFIHIQDPYIAPENFDLVVAMEHDKISGTNVIKTHFALHALTPDVLQNAAGHFAARFLKYPKPYVAVLLGGSTNKYTLSKAGMMEVILSLKRLLDGTDASLLITPSRRTGEENIALLTKAFLGNPRVYIYNFSDENPYLGLLALADVIIVTNDSVNMMSEAHATEKPLYILPLSGHANTKPAQFAEKLLLDGIARAVGTKLESWSYAADNEMANIGTEIKRRLGLR
jgi:mitochondrial fission protein ELM1